MTKGRIEKIYKWLFDEDNPALTKWISTPIKKNQNLPVDILLTELDILKLITPEF